MEKKIKSGLIVIIIGIILLGGFLIWNNYRQIGNLQYTVIELPEAKILEMYTMPCMMIYWDDVRVYYDKTTKGFVNKTISISVDVGKPESPNDVIDKWTHNVAKLERMYKDAFKQYDLYDSLYGNFLWSKHPKIIELKYRTSNEGYSRDGWYIFTSSPSFLEEGRDYGEFFLSDNGVLMPVERTCTTICCP